MKTITLDAVLKILHDLEVEVRNPDSYTGSVYNPTIWALREVARKVQASVITSPPSHPLKGD